METHPEFDLFISYNSRDRRIIEELTERLYDHGINCWLDGNSIRAGDLWEREIKRAMSSSRGCLIALGSNGWGEYHLKEAQQAIGQRDSTPQYHIIPVLLPTASAEDKQRVGGLFDQTQHVPWDPDGDNEESVERIEAAIRDQSPYPVGKPRMSPFMIRRDARLWLQAKSAGHLYRGRKLRAAQQMHERFPRQFDEKTIEFINRSLRYERFVGRLISSTIGVVCVFLGALLVWNFVLRSKAETLAASEAHAKRDTQVALVDEHTVRSDLEMQLSRPRGAFDALRKAHDLSQKVFRPLLPTIRRLTEMYRRYPLPLLTVRCSESPIRLARYSEALGMIVLNRDDGKTEVWRILPPRLEARIEESRQVVALTLSGTSHQPAIRAVCRMDISGETSTEHDLELVSWRLDGTVTSRVPLGRAAHKAPCEFDVDGTHVAMLQPPGEFRVWRATDGQLISASDLSRSAHSGVLAFSPAAAHVALNIMEPAVIPGVDPSRVATLFRIDTRHWRPERGGSLLWWIHLLCPSMDGEQVAMVGHDFYMFLGADGRLLPPRGTQESGVLASLHRIQDVSAVCFGPDNELLIGNREGELSEHCPKSPSSVGRFVWNDAHVVHISWSNQWRLWVAAFANGSVSLWDRDAIAGRMRLGLPSGASFVVSAQLLDRDKIGVTLDRTGAVRTWDLISGRVLSLHPGDGVAEQRTDPLDRTGLVCLKPDGTRLIWSSSAHRIQCVNPTNGEAIWDITDKLVQPMGAADWKAGKLATRWSFDKIALWNLTTGERAGLLETEKAFPSAVAFARNRVVAGDEAGGVYVWHGETLDLQAVEVLEGGRISAICCSENGDRIAVCLDEGRAAVLSVPELETVREVSYDSLKFAALSGDGRVLVTAGEGGLIRLWEVESGQELQPPADVGGQQDWTCLTMSGNRGILLGSYGDAMFYDLQAAQRVLPIHIAGTGSITGFARLRWLADCGRLDLAAEIWSPGDDARAQAEADDARLVWAVSNTLPESLVPRDSARTPLWLRLVATSAPRSKK